jgi:hypothetical protein
VKTIVRILLSLFNLIIGYDCMVEAFHLLNEPSDRAVYKGMAILASLCIFQPLVLWQLWRSSRVNFR